MITVDRLNTDVLELVFSHLAENDLHSVTLVSMSFYDGVLPLLYKTLSMCYTMRHGKTFPHKCSPFVTVLRSRGLAKYVHHIDICYVPYLPKSSSVRPLPDPTFLKECRAVLQICKNLLSFTCLFNILPSILPGLDKRTDIQELRVYTSDLKALQAESLMKMQGLKTLFLDHSSWAVMNILPKWSESISTTLHTLAFYNCLYLTETVLECALQKLSGLINLHIVGCPRINHITLFRLLIHTPALEGLSFTTFPPKFVVDSSEYPQETSKPLDRDPDLRHLRELSIDTRYFIVSQRVPVILTEVMTHLERSMASLSSFKMRVSEPQVLVGAFVDQLLASHAHSLKRLTFIGCTVKPDSLTLICKSCLNLERLDICIPNFKDPVSRARFIYALGRSMSLQTLVDTGDHTAHGAHIFLRQGEVRKIMVEAPQMTTVVSDKKCWTCRRLTPLATSMEHINIHSKTQELWFMSTN